MDNSLEELRKKAVIEITNKIVNNMTMSEIMEVVIKYSEQTAKKVVGKLDREKLEQIIGKKLTIDKNIKRTPIKKHLGWSCDSSPAKKREVKKSPKDKKPNKKGDWLSFFDKDKKKHSGWNKKKEEETFFSRIKKFLNINE